MGALLRCNLADCLAAWLGGQGVRFRIGGVGLFMRHFGKIKPNAGFVAGSPRRFLVNASFVATHWQKLLRRQPKTEPEKEE